MESFAYLAITRKLLVCYFSVDMLLNSEEVEEQQAPIYASTALIYNNTTPACGLLPRFS